MIEPYSYDVSFVTVYVHADETAHIAYATDDGRGHKLNFDNEDAALAHAQAVVRARALV